MIVSLFGYPLRFKVFDGNGEEIKNVIYIDTVTGEGQRFCFENVEKPMTNISKLRKSFKAPLPIKITTMYGADISDPTIFDTACKFATLEQAITLHHRRMVSRRIMRHIKFNQSLPNS